jgi:hypothetical protein
MSRPTSGLGIRAYLPPPSKPLRRRRIPPRRSRAPCPRSHLRAAAHHRSNRRSARRCARRRRASPRPPCTSAREGRLHRSDGRGSSSHPPALWSRADPAEERDPAARASRIGDPASRRCRIVTAPGPGRTGKRHARGHTAPQRSGHASGRDSVHPGSQERPGQGVSSPAPGPRRLPCLRASARDRRRERGAPEREEGEERGRDECGCCADTHRRTLSGGGDGINAQESATSTRMSSLDPFAWIGIEGSSQISAASPVLMRSPTTSASPSIR